MKYDTRLYRPFTKQGSPSTSHCVPLKPGAQLQLYPLIPSVQVPLFLQGWLAQASFWEHKKEFLSVISSKMFLIKQRH